MTSFDSTIKPSNHNLKVFLVHYLVQFLEHWLEMQVRKGRGKRDLQANLQDLSCEGKTKLLRIFEDRNKVRSPMDMDALNF